MTLPAPGVSLSLLQINAEFGYGTNLGAYLGKQWYQDNSATGVFSAPISIFDFYSKRVNSPVTPGSQSFGAGPYSFTVPLYSVLNVTIRAGAGGGGGGSGNQGGGGPGQAGQNTSWGAYQAFAGAGGASGGQGSQAGAAGAGSDGSPAGGGGGGPGFGGASGGSGGAGGKTPLTLYNPVPGNPAPYGPAVGAVVSGSVGSGGAGGPKGSGVVIVGPTAVPQQGQDGGGGGQGSVAISWS